MLVMPNLFGPYAMILPGGGPCLSILPSTLYEEPFRINSIKTLRGYIYRWFQKRIGEDISRHTDVVNTDPSPQKQNP